MIETSIDDLLAKIMRSVENNSISVSKGVVDAFNLGCAFAAIKAIDEKEQQISEQIIEPEYEPVADDALKAYLEDFWEHHNCYDERSKDNRMISVSLKAENLPKFYFSAKAFRNNRTRYVNYLIEKDYKEHAGIYQEILEKYPKKRSRGYRNKRNSNEVADAC